MFTMRFSIKLCFCDPREELTKDQMKEELVSISRNTFCWSGHSYLRNTNALVEQYE